jgi:hypothetical protein
VGEDTVIMPRPAFVIPVLPPAVAAAVPVAEPEEIAVDPLATTALVPMMDEVDERV